MNDAQARKVIMAEYVMALAVISWVQIKKGNLPEPRRYVGASIVYGLLGLLEPVISANVAALLGAAALFGIAGTNVKSVVGATSAATGGVKVASYGSQGISTGGGDIQATPIPNATGQTGGGGGSVAV